MHRAQLAAAGWAVGDQIERESLMPFTLTAISPFTVIGSGPQGEYVIVQHGYHPQLGRAFCYRDNKYSFYFYVQTKDDLPRYTLSVWYSSSGLFAGGTPPIEAADADYLEENIQHYL